MDIFSCVKKENISVICSIKISQSIHKSLASLSLSLTLPKRRTQKASFFPISLVFFFPFIWLYLVLLFVHLLSWKLWIAILYTMCITHHEHFISQHKMGKKNFFFIFCCLFLSFYLLATFHSDVFIVWVLCFRKSFSFIFHRNQIPNNNL